MEKLKSNKFQDSKLESLHSITGGGGYETSKSKGYYGSEDSDCSTPLSSDYGYTSDNYAGQTYFENLEFRGEC